MEHTVLQVSDFVGLVNQTLEFAYPVVVIEGEVSGFNISKNKWVFFDLKDKESTINCFMTVYQLKLPIEDGMKIQIRATPKLTKWGRFSVTVQAVKPVGEGNLQRAFEILKAKLDKEGLFAPERKRLLPRFPNTIGVIASTESAGYADFIKVTNNRWRGLSIHVADVQVQGEPAEGQVCRAIDYFNQSEEPVDVVVIIRGGGSKDDLLTFNTESVARAIASSRSPVLVGVGHETDHSLADFAADVRAATPTNAAEIVVPNRSEIRGHIAHFERLMPQLFLESINDYKQRLKQTVHTLSAELLAPKARIELLQERLKLYNPANVLAKGYSLVRSGEVLVTSVKDVKKGDKIGLELRDGHVGAVIDG